MLFRHALAAALTVLAFGCTGVVSAAPAGESGGDARASGWAASAGTDSAGNAPSMNSKLAAQADGPNIELLSGVVLVGLAVLALALGLAPMPRKPREGPAELAAGWRLKRRRLPAGSGASR